MELAAFALEINLPKEIVKRVVRYFREPTVTRPSGRKLLVRVARQNIPYDTQRLIFSHHKLTLSQVLHAICDPEYNIHPLPGAHPFERVCVEVEQGNIAKVMAMINNGLVEPTFRNSHLLYVAAKHGHTELVSFLLQKGCDPSTDNPLMIACEFGHYDIAKLLYESGADPSLDENFAISLAAEYGHLDIVKLLFHDPRVDPSDRTNYALRMACEYNHYEVVKFLLSDPRVDPSAADNISIQIAAQEGRADMCRLLLQDPRVDPSVDNNFMIRSASTCGHIEVVKLLLEHPKIDPLSHNGYALLGSLSNGYEDVAIVLLNDERVANWVRTRQKEHRCLNALFSACQAGMHSVVKMLASLMALDDTSRYTEQELKIPLRWAAYEGCMESVRCLIDLPQIHIHQSQILDALHGGNDEMIKLFFEKYHEELKKDATDESDTDSGLSTDFLNKCMRIMAGHGTAETAKYLIETYSVKVLPEHLWRAMTKGQRKTAEFLAHYTKIRKADLGNTLVTVCKKGRLKTLMLLLYKDVIAEMPPGAKIIDHLTPDTVQLAMEGAVTSRDVELVLQLIKNSIGSYAMALNKACGSNAKNIVEGLLEHVQQERESATADKALTEAGEHRNALSGKDILSGLKAACFSGSLEIIELLLSPPWNAILRDSGLQDLEASTPLASAASVGHDRVIERLLASTQPKFDPCSKNYLAFRCMPVVTEGGAVRRNYKRIARMMSVEVCWQKLGMLVLSVDDLNIPYEILVVTGSKLMLILKNMVS